ncbi:MAG: chromosome segregation protein SMC [Phycisphaerae bacterium]
MFLKRITLSGFKSFADRVDLDFGRGVTGIVGPNGCGKSNVLDSLKWVLGEQSARSLRGSQMVDMIFSGSATRRASGVAQVNIVFGNDDRSLAMDHDEVVVTRKLYRSGESEYLLNNESARLKDIRELFMDTGVGVNAYSVIEQGRVDALLQSSASERRTIFEEAAGISKYKSRKKEALRKLDRTEQNLLRAEDIIEELQRRLRSVKLQAGKARNYKEYEARLNELRSTFVMAEYHRFAQDAARRQEQSQELSDQVTQLETQIARIEAEDARGLVQLDELSEQVASTANASVSKRSLLAALEERVEAAQHRIGEQEALLERSRQRQKADQDRVQRNQEDLEAVSVAAEQFVEQIERNRADIDGMNERDADLARNLAELHAELEEDKSAILDVLRKSGQVHNEIARLNSHRESAIAQKGRLCERDAKITSELQMQLETQAELRREACSHEVALGAQEQSLEELKGRASRVNADRQELVDRAAGLKEDRSALTSRRDVLLQLQRKRDGVGEGVRQWLAAIHADESTGDEGLGLLVADVFDADVPHAHLIEAVLGERDQYLVAEKADAFLERARSLGLLDGRINAICLDRIGPVVNERDFSAEPGFVTRALDLVRVPPAYAFLARHLLGKTVVVEDMPSAMAMAAHDVAGHCFVTLQGELIKADGSIALGPHRGGTGLISRKSELREIEMQLALVDRELEELTGRLTRNQSQANELEQAQRTLRSAIHELNTKQADVGARLAKAAEAIDRLSGEKPLIDREVALIDQQVEEVLAKNEARSRQLEALERESESLEAKVAARQARIEEVEGRRSSMQQALTELKVAQGQLSEKRATATERVNALKQLALELQESVEAAQHDMEQAGSRIEEARRTVQTGSQQRTALAAEIATLDARADELQEAQAQLRLETEERQAQLKEARGRLHVSEESLHECQMALAETNVRKEELVARVADELNIDLVSRYESYQYEEQDWESIEQEIGQLRQKMARLGNVNLAAIDELAELEERHGFLTGQRDDLTTSRRQLEQLIEKLDQESRVRFQEAFTLIRDHFRALFRKLFGGGKADIVLEDADDPLDSGIEIVAQPPGKELQIISLMSGGEKSMTAIALLMSIFKCRPAPFVVLDEVDAALDEANNERFNLLIQEFITESQFIVITHSKRTMSIAEQLYGITMQEPGVSTLVSVQLSDANVA